MTQCYTSDIKHLEIHIDISCSRYYEQAVPFQRYRKSIIRADFARTLRNIDLGRCLDECLHQAGDK